MRVLAILAFCLVGIAGGSAAAQTNCPIRLGGIISVTGPQGQIGKGIADTARMAVDHVNEAGGVRGCPVEFILRDDSSQPTLSVDAARFLVDAQKVSAIVGLVGSGPTISVVSNVSAPAGVPTVSCCGVAPALTKMSAEGKTGGYFFRTIPTAKTYALAYAKAIADRGYKKTAIIYVNNDFGISILGDAKVAIEKLGGQVVSSTAYNESQPTYRPEVTRALGDRPDSLLLIAYTQDGITILRDWLSLGGTPNLVLHNTLRSNDVVAAVGARFLGNAVGVDNAQVTGPSVEAFQEAFVKTMGRPPIGPGLHTMYDAVVATALAIQAAPQLDGASIRDSMRASQTEGGLEVLPGPANLRKGFEAIRNGQKIRYVGATGPFKFDANGDVAGPAIIWKFDGSQIVTEKTISLDEITALARQTGL